MDTTLTITVFLIFLIMVGLIGGISSYRNNQRLKKEFKEMRERSIKRQNDIFKDVIEKTKPIVIHLFINYQKKDSDKDIFYVAKLLDVKHYHFALQSKLTEQELKDIKIEVICTCPTLEEAKEDADILTKVSRENNFKS